MVEDSIDDMELVRAELELAGLPVVIERVETAEQMNDALRTQAWDAVISDYNLPTFSTEGALDVLHALHLDIPFIIVSGCIGEEKAVALMKAGAHDFVMKDNLARLAPALERELREAEMRAERTQTQERLEANEQFLRAMTAALGEGVLVQDRTGRLVYMNPEAERLLGWSLNELAPLDLHDTLHPPEGVSGHHSKDACPILNVANVGGVYRSYDDVFVCKDGEMLPVAYVTTAMYEHEEVTGVVTVFKDIAARKQMEQELQDSRTQLRSLSMFQQTAREEERKHIARELHDELGQALTALKIDLDWLVARRWADDPQVGDKLDAMNGILEKTVESVRRIAEDLRPGMLDDLGLAASVEWLAHQFQQRSGIACDLTMNRDEFELADNASICVFRIVQEMLTNVARHAGASRVQVELRQDDGNVHVVVQDNGCGFVVGKVKKRSFGLLGIRERVSMLGGSLDLSSAPGEGTTIQVTVPRHPQELSA